MHALTPSPITHRPPPGASRRHTVAIHSYQKETTDQQFEDALDDLKARHGTKCLKLTEAQEGWWVVEKKKKGRWKMVDCNEGGGCDCQKFQQQKVRIVSVRASPARDQVRRSTCSHSRQRTRRPTVQEGIRLPSCSHLQGPNQRSQEMHDADALQ